MSYETAEQLMDGFQKAVVSMAKQAKSHICEMSRGPADLPPVIVWVSYMEGNEQAKVNMLPLVFCEDTSSDLVVRKGLADAFRKFGFPVAAAIVAEAYSAPIESQSEAEKYSRGQLGREFRSGNLTGINEIVTAILFDPKGNKRGLTIGYKYDDRGSPTYGEVEQVTSFSNSRGAIVDAVDDFVAIMGALLIKPEA